MKTWYSLLKNESATVPTVELSIHDAIGSWNISAKDFLADLRSAGDIQQINLSLNSPGGSVFDGFAIANALRAHPANVNVEIIGLAASIASVIAMSGNSVKIHPAAYLMIHNPWGYAAGDAEEMRATAELLDKLRNTIAETYASRMNLPLDEIKTIMDAETWYDGKEAVAAGLADVLVAAATQNAAPEPSNLIHFLNTPDSLLPQEQPAAPSEKAWWEKMVAGFKGGLPTAQPSAEIREQITALTTRATAAENAMGELSALVAARDAEIATLTAAAASVGAEAARLVASLVIVPENELPPNRPGEQKTYAETYKEMPPGPERIAYLAKHESAILRAAVMPSES